MQVQGSHCLNKKMGISDSNEGDFDDDGDIDVDALLIKVKEYEAQEAERANSGLFKRMLSKKENPPVKPKRRM